MLSPPRTSFQCEHTTVAVRCPLSTCSVRRRSIHDTWSYLDAVAATSSAERTTISRSSVVWTTTCSDSFLFSIRLAYCVMAKKMWKINRHVSRLGRHKVSAKSERCGCISARMEENRSVRLAHLPLELPLQNEANSSHTRKHRLEVLLLHLFYHLS